jgi:hypothetical protein
MMMRGPHLKINRISSIEPIHDLPYGIIGVTIKDVEVSNSFFIEEWTSYATMESNTHISACR